MDRVYMIWESEDQGFQFPSEKFPHAFKYFNDALTQVESTWKNHIQMSVKKYGQHLGPNGHGRISALFLPSDETETIEFKENGNNLSVLDWIYVMEVEVK